MRSVVHRWNRHRLECANSAVEGVPSIMISAWITTISLTPQNEYSANNIKWHLFTFIGKKKENCYFCGAFISWLHEMLTICRCCRPQGHRDMCSWALVCTVSDFHLLICSTSIFTESTSKLWNESHSHEKRRVQTAGSAVSGSGLCTFHQLQVSANAVRVNGTCSVHTKSARYFPMWQIQ